jgi:hypothetical protein
MDGGKMIALLLTASIALTGVPATPVPIVMHKHDAVQTGAQPSAYRGKFYSKTIEKTRLCVGQREGRFQYWGTGSNGFYEGTYQVTDALATGAAWMMRKELREMWGHTVGTEISRMLRNNPAHKWHRFYQDMMFFTVASWNGEGSGLKHWRGGRYAC